MEYHEGILIRQIFIYWHRKVFMIGCLRLGSQETYSEERHVQNVYWRVKGQESRIRYRENLTCNVIITETVIDITKNFY